MKKSYEHLSSQERERIAIRKIGLSPIALLCRNILYLYQPITNDMT